MGSFEKGVRLLLQYGRIPAAHFHRSNFIRFLDRQLSIRFLDVNPGDIIEREADDFAR